MSDDLEGSIARYRRDLGSSSMSSADADELEDHLRALIAELRAAGRATDVAFAEAVTRLGEPRALVREYERATPAFGPAPSRLRAWSAAALLVGPLLLYLWNTSSRRIDRSLLGLDTLAILIDAGLLCALVVRRSWARGVLLGVAAASAIECLFVVPAATSVPVLLSVVLAYAGAAVLLLPWRWAELSRVGWSVVALGVGHGGVGHALWHSNLHSWDPVSVAALVSWLAFMVGSAGVVVRARWASGALAVSALALIPVVEWMSTNPLPSRGYLVVLWTAVMAVGALAIAIAAVLAHPAGRWGLPRGRPAPYARSR